MSLRSPLLGLCLAVLTGTAAAEESGAGSVAWIDFDIPAQPLASALGTYAAATHIQLFIDAALISGRRSSALKGSFTAEAGLAGLVAGTGLTPQAIRNEGFTLVPEQAAPAGEGPEQGALPSDPASSTVVRFAAYSAALQAALKDALCSREETRPGSYRTLLRLWIDPAGAVAGVALVTSAGSRPRDAVMSDALRKLKLGTPPPGLPQPITVLLAPSLRPEEDYCPPIRPTPRRVDADGEVAR
jgi:hypothetical protein